ncbi:Metallo-dependent phosphatase [Imleria badia]|nr:Metallo-dependent phosphatase [Imleria badia]
MSRLSIVHWNDAYRVTPQKMSPNGDTIDVTQFAALLHGIRRNWLLRSDGAHDGLSLFSGDLFSPSVESTVTRGSHMVPVMNELAPDVALTGNHDFDFGYPHLSKLVDDTKFPWLLSNIVDENTNSVPEHLHLFKVLERSSVRVGIIGLVEEDWISTISGWPPNFKFKDMAETGRELSQRLRGEHQCDVVIALTHARVPNDIKLAKDLFALSPSVQNSHSIAGEHGVDIVLGGHDHLYFASKGVTTWEGYDVSNPSIGSEEDNGDILVVKSGTDFRELSELTLQLDDTPPGSVRKKVIKAVHGKRHEIRPGMPSSKNLQKLLDGLLSSLSEELKVPVCITKVELDLRSQFLRTMETAAGNWFADALRHAYDDALYTTCGNGSDGVLLCSGTLRGDSVYSAGEITLGNILEILPFDDPVVVLELDGKTLWDVLEAGVSRYPAQEGRNLPDRVWLTHFLGFSPSACPGAGTPALVDGKFVERVKNGRMYKIVTREYMATGHGGYTALLGYKYLIGGENGQPMSSLVKEYLLGARSVDNSARLRERKDETYRLHSETVDVARQEIEHQTRHPRKRLWTKFIQRWQHTVANALQELCSRSRDQVAAREHTRGVAHYDGKKVRRGSEGNDNNGHDSEETYSQDRLFVIHPVIDGRFKDVGRS